MTSDRRRCPSLLRQVFRGHKKEAASLSWHPIHETLFSSGGSDGSLMFWNVGYVTCAPRTITFTAQCPKIC